VRLRTHRKRTTRFVAAGTAVATFAATLLATLAALVATTVAPAAAGTNGTTLYEVDCVGTSLAAGQTAPFIVGLNANTNVPDPSPAGTSFGLSGVASETLIGPIIAGAYQQVNLALTGGLTASVGGVTVATTDGSATGSFTYTHNFGNQAAPGAQRTGVSYTAGSTLLTAAAGTFQASDLGTPPTNPMFVAGPSASINPQSTVVSVAGDGSSITISIPTLVTESAVNVGLGQSLTFADPAFSTGNVFTSSGAAKSNVGVTSMASTTLSTAGGGIVVPFGGSPGVGATNCLETGWDAVGNPGPVQTGGTPPATTPLLPPPPNNPATPLVLASGGFIAQPGTTQMITPPAAAFVAGDQGPVTSNATATIDRNVSNTATVTLPATDNDATGVASCSVVPGSISDPRLTVNPNGGGTCLATLTDTDGASTGATVTFNFTAVDTANNPSTPAGGSTVTVTITPIPHLAVTTTSLPNGVVGSPYSATLMSSGGTAPVTWAVTTGTLPAGLTLNGTTGAITGTPTTAGTSNFTVTATDSDSPAETATANLSIFIDAPPATTDATFNMTAGGTTTVTLPATDTDATPVASCAVVSGPSDPRLTVSISNSPTPCQATLTDSGSTTASVTFTFNATDTASLTGNTSTATVNIAAPINDGSLNVIVNGPVSSTKTSKALVGKVTNTGNTTFTVCDTNFSWVVTVNGAPTGSVTMPAACATLSPGASHRFKATWNYPAGSVATGDTVVFQGTVNIAGDPTPGDNTDMETRTAK
jgi:hypothetical protein